MTNLTLMPHNLASPDSHQNYQAITDFLIKKTSLKYFSVGFQGVEALKGKM